MKRIPLTRGMVALVDDSDYELLSHWKWSVQQSAKNHFYACRAESGTTVSMHRVIMAPPTGMVVDHINGDGLDNRRANLRICTREQNQRNRRTPINNACGLKGVSWDRGKWAACLWLGGRNRHLGRYQTKEEAARAYDREALEQYGEFARLNFPKEVQQ